MLFLLREPSYKPLSSSTFGGETTATARNGFSNYSSTVDQRNIGSSSMVGAVVRSKPGKTKSKGRSGRSSSSSSSSNSSSDDGDTGVATKKKGPPTMPKPAASLMPFSR